MPWPLRQQASQGKVPVLLSLKIDIVEAGASSREEEEGASARRGSTGCPPSRRLCSSAKR